MHSSIGPSSSTQLDLHVFIVADRTIVTLDGLTFVGLSELSCETAPTLMSASKSTPSIVRNFGSG